MPLRPSSWVFPLVPAYHLPVENIGPPGFPYILYVQHAASCNPDEPALASPSPAQRCVAFNLRRSPGTRHDVHFGTNSPSPFRITACCLLSPGFTTFVTSCRAGFRSGWSGSTFPCRIPTCMACMSFAWRTPYRTPKAVRSVVQI